MTLVNQVLGCKKVELHLLPREVTSILDFLNNGRGFPDQVQDIEALEESPHSPAGAPAWLFINCSLTNLISAPTWHRVQEQLRRHAHCVLYTISPHTAYQGGEYNILCLYPLTHLPEGHSTFVRIVPAPRETFGVVQAALHHITPVVSTYYPVYNERSA
jgi:hypothetical protein